MPDSISNFDLHPQLAKDSHSVCMLSLCELRLMNDSQYPWVLLVPQVGSVREIHALSADQQQTLMQEITHVSGALQTLTGAQKMNVAALGNMVPQLHVHIIARFEDDPAWPGPIWGVLPMIPYENSQRKALITKIKTALDAA